MPQIAPRNESTTRPVELAGGVPFPAWVEKATIGVTMLAALSATWNNVTFGGIQIADLFLVVVFGSILLQVAFGELRFPIPGWIWAPVAAMLVCVTVRAASPPPDAYFSFRYQTADVVPGSIVKAFFWVLALVGVPVAIIACSALSSNAPKWIAGAFLTGVVGSSAVAVSDLSGFTSIAASLGYESNNVRQVGLAGHPTTLGLICVIAVPLTIYFMASRGLRLLAVVSLIVLTGGVFASGSRGAQAALPIAVIAAVAMSPLRKTLFKWFAVSALAAVAVGAGLLWKLKPDVLAELLRFKGSGGGGASDSDREILASQALHDFSEFPVFGLGIKHVIEAHSIYLEVISAGGIVLGIGMLVYWGGAVFAAWRGRNDIDGLGTALLASLGVWLALGAIQNQLTDRYLYYTVGCIAALASTRLAYQYSRGSVDAVSADSTVMSRM